jgi:hypothetical protein
MMRRTGCDETFKAAAVCSPRRDLQNPTVQLVAESLVFDRCRNERGSSMAVTPAAILSLEFRFRT